MIINATDMTFQEEVLNSSTPVFVDFWATWCGPCKMLAPVIEELSNKFEGEVKVVKVDVDENPEVSNKFGIMSIPTMLLFNEGKAIGKIVGFKPADQIEAAIRSAISK